MDKIELRRRRRFRLSYQLDKKEFDTGNYPNLEKYHLENIKILEEYEKNERT